MKRVIHSAPIVYNGLGNPRRNGAVLVQEALGKRTVAAVGDALELRDSNPEVTVSEHPFALSPPPVNAHTHLDLSSMPFTPGSYEEFIAAVIGHVAQGGRSLESVRRGVEELRRAGTRVIGDIVTREDAMRYLLEQEELAGVAYWEVIGPDPDEAPGKLQETERKIEEFLSLERASGMKLGLSPHSPHTVSAPLLQGLTTLARRYRLPLQLHVAEAPGEIALHRSGDGPLASLLASLGQRWQPSGLTPVGYLASLGVLDAAPTLVHMVHVNEDDVALVQRSGCVVVHCPRSNEALGCGRFPWELYARHGVTVALGSDSRGSSPNLDVEEEVQAALKLHGERAGRQALVRAAVKGGYRALGLTPPRLVRGDDASGFHSWRRVHGMT